MISRSLKMWRGHLLQITDKEPCCIDEAENSRVSVFPSGGRAPRGGLKESPGVSAPLSLTSPRRAAHIYGPPADTDSQRPASLSLDMSPGSGKMLMLTRGRCQRRIINNVCELTALF